MRAPLTCLLLALPALAAPNASLDKATKLYADLNYTDAGKALEAALKQPGNDRGSLLKILELQAVVVATLGQQEKAAKIFEQLLALDPEFKLQGNYPPRVTTSFYEARSFIETNGHLEVKYLDAVVEPGAVKQVRVEVTKDPLKQVKKARFHFAPKGEVVAALAGNALAAAPPAPAAELSFWVEVLGDKDAVLLELGSASSLRVERAPPKPGELAATPPIPEVETPPTEGGPPPVPPPMVTVPRLSAPLPVKKIAAFGLMGAGVACLGVGVAFGLNANATKAQFDAATKNKNGQINNLTQVQAYALDAQQRSQATIANVFYVSAGALAVAGAAVLVLDLVGPSARAQLVPTGPGLALVGTFP